MNDEQKEVLAKTYMCEEKRRQARLEPHELIEEAMSQWNQQSDVYSSIKKDAANDEDGAGAISIIDTNVRKDKKQKLEELMAHLSQKHAQLLHAVNAKERLESEQVLTKENKKIKGKYGETLSSLIQFHSDVQNDTKLLNDMNLEVDRELKFVKNKLKE